MLRGISSIQLVSAFRSVASTVVAIGGGIAVGWAILYGIGKDPGSIWYLIFSEAWGTPFGLSLVLIETVPLLTVSLGLVICFRAGVWNVGGQGQMVIGALFANVVGYSFGPLHPAIMIPMVLLAGVLGGVVWALPAAIFKARWGVNEIIVTLMMNFIALNLLTFLATTILRNPAREHPMTYPILPTAKLPFIAGTTVHIGILIALALVVVVYVVMSRTVLGYQFKVAGLSLKAARYAGMPISRLLFISLLISGGFCGLAGGIQVSGVLENLDPEYMPAYGLEAVPLVFLAKLNAIAVLPFSMFFASLLVGSEIMHRSIGIPVFFVDIVFGLMLLFFAAAEIARTYQFKWRLRRS